MRRKTESNDVPDEFEFAIESSLTLHLNFISSLSCPPLAFLTTSRPPPVEDTKTQCQLSIRRITPCASLLAVTLKQSTTRPPFKTFLTPTPTSLRANEERVKRGEKE